ncbi:MAG: mycofactocin-associated electron transfer flavoprotein beta subunit [Ilumatobacteraceae bacterium]
MKILVCWKWVSLDAERIADPRWSGVSNADEAALETALTLAASADPPATVHVVCVGSAAADDALRTALAVGADHVTRIDASSELDSRVVAAALAAHATDADLVLCGDASVDRGTGSVPAFIADELGCAQALGLVSVEPQGPTFGSLRVTRRLDGGRREILDVDVPAVLSVEGAVARLRRAPMAASLATRRAEVATVTGPPGQPSEAEVQPYRPRTRAVAAPRGDSLERVRQILDVGGGDNHAELVTLDPPDAARRILEQLRDWGYLDAPDT